MTTFLAMFERRLASPAFAVALLMTTQLLVADASLSPVSEEIVSVSQVAGFPGPRTVMSSELTFASASSWHTDPDHEVLTLVVTQGVLEVQLSEGAARIDRHASWLADTAREPLVPGMAATLLTGDRLVVVRGYLLTVKNRNNSPATAVIHRSQHN